MCKKIKISVELDYFHRNKIKVAMVTVLKKGTSVEMKREQLKAISKKKSKGINAFKYLGILKKKIDPLKFQKQLRDEWG